MNKIINITKSAEEYLSKLIKDKNDIDLSIRIFIADPGTPKAETCLAYCKPDEAMPDDMIINLDLINVNIEKKSIPFLKDAEVNFDNDTFGGQLTIKAPNARMPNISPDSPIEDRINYIIYNEINPMLESHGGEVSLVEFNDKNELVDSMINYLKLKKEKASNPLPKTKGEFENEKIHVSEIDYYYSNVIARASKTMSECRNSLSKVKKTGTYG